MEITSFVCHSSLKIVDLVMAHNGLLSQWKLFIFFIAFTSRRFLNSCRLYSCLGLNMAKNEALQILQFSGDNWDMWCQILQFSDDDWDAWCHLLCYAIINKVDKQVY